MTDILAQAGGTQAIARELGLSEQQVSAAAAALGPSLMEGFQQPAAGAPDATVSPFGGLGALLEKFGGGGGLLDSVLSPQPTDVAPGNDILGQIFGSKERSREVAQDAAASTGLAPSVLKKMLPMLAMMAVGYMAKQRGGAAGGAQGGGLGGILGNILAGR